MKLDDEAKAGIFAFAVLAFIIVAVFTGHGTFVLGATAIIMTALVADSIIGIMRENQRRKMKEIRRRHKIDKQFAVEMALLERDEDTDDV